MRHIYLELFNLVRINFNTIIFRNESKKKTDVSIQLVQQNDGIDMPVGFDHVPFEFMNQLSFVNKLKDLIPSGGFKIGSDTGPFVEVDTQSVRLGYTLPIPNLTFGAFTIENIKLISVFELPLKNLPLRFKFSFGKREEPFIITVSMLGGGGFFSISMGADGIEIIELSMEFGAHSAIDFGGVAYGSVHMMAGVFMKFTGERDPPITGFINAYGRICVLGMISASVEFYLGLTYDHKLGTVHGIATLYVKIKTLFFKRSVGVTLERVWKVNSDRSLQGIDNIQPVKFKDLMSFEDWRDYYNAFVEWE
jgi:hypothetical protein